MLQFLLQQEACLIEKSFIIQMVTIGIKSCVPNCVNIIDRKASYYIDRRLQELKKGLFLARAHYRKLRVFCTIEAVRRDLARWLLFGNWTRYGKTLSRSRAYPIQLPTLHRLTGPRHRPPICRLRPGVGVGPAVTRPDPWFRKVKAQLVPGFAHSVA
jgi:hypothetical protein